MLLAYARNAALHLDPLDHPDMALGDWLEHMVEATLPKGTAHSLTNGQVPLEVPRADR